MTQITPQRLQQWLADGARKPPLLLDVREPWEQRTCQIAGSMLAPMNTIPARVHELDRDAETVVICHHGVRSLRAAAYLEHCGFTDVVNLSGGIDAWARTVDPAMALY